METALTEMVGKAEAQRIYGRNHAKQAKAQGWTRNPIGQSYETMAEWHYSPEYVEGFMEIWNSKGAN